MATPRSTQRCRQPRSEVTPCVPSPIPTGDPIAPRGYAAGNSTRAGRRPWSTTTAPEDHTPTPGQGVETRPHESRPGAAHIPPLYPFFRPLNPAFPDSGKNREEKAEGSEAPSDKYYGLVPPL